MLRITQLNLHLNKTKTKVIRRTIITTPNKLTMLRYRLANSYRIGVSKIDLVYQHH